MLHVTETWPLTSQDLQRLQRNDRAMIRQICNVKPENVATVRSNELLAMTWTLSREKKGFLGLNRLNDPVEQLRQFGTCR